MARKPKGFGHGGLRPGAGRPRGSKNRRTLAVLEQATAEDLELPLPRLLRRMNDPLLDERYRDALAAIAAPYCHAKQATVTRLKRLSEMTDAELDQQIAWAKEDSLLLGADIRAQLTSASASALPESASAASGSSLRASSKTRSPE